MPSGGARLNSGPDKGTKYAKTIGREEHKQMLRDLLKPHLADVTEALVTKAKMMDVAAVKEFYERLMGKVTEEIDHTSGGEPLFLPSELMRKHDITSGTDGDSE